MGKSSAKNNVIITGTTGMVGEGVLIQCLSSPEIDSILVINRKPCGYHHPKLKEIMHEDFFNLSPIADQLVGYNACFFCLGISSVGADTDVYYKMTYTLTMHVAEMLAERNAGMTFCYVSGAGTNAQGKTKWAQVKGKTEIDLMKLSFDQVFNFRPGLIKPIPAQKYAHHFYKYINWLFPVGRAIYPAGFCTMAELADAMINTLSHHEERKILDGNDIIALAKKSA